MPPPAKKKLGELLVEAGIIDEPQLRYALAHQRQWGGKLGQALVDLKLASEPQIVRALAAKLGYDVVSLEGIARDRATEPALALLPREVARRNAVLPVASDGSTVTVAMSDPTNVAVADEIAFRTGRRVKIAIAGDRELVRAVTRLYFPEEALEPAERAIELTDVGSAKPLNPTLDALPEHLQERFFQTTLPGVEAERRPQAGASTPAREAAVRELLDRMAAGEEPPDGLRVGRVVAALAKALLRRGLVTEAELVTELVAAQPRR